MGRSEYAGMKLVHGRCVIVDPARLPGEGIVWDGAVLVSGNVVESVGSMTELSDRYPEIATLGSSDHIVMPGLVNSHSHGRGLTTFQLGAVDDYLEPWLLDFWAVKPLDVYLDTLYSCLKAIRSGVTTILHSGYTRHWGEFAPETWSALRAYDDSGVRVAFALQASDRNTFVYEDDEDFLQMLPRELSSQLEEILAEFARPARSDYLTLLEQLEERYDGDPRVRILVGPVGPQWCSDSLLTVLSQAADSYGTGLHLHCVESPYQREFSVRAYGHGAITHLEKLGMLGPRVSLAHAIWLSEREMDMCAGSGTSVCHNASSNLRLRVGVMPAATMLDKGITVCIGMDGTTLNDDDDMFQEMRLVSKLHRLPRGLPYQPCPCPADVVRMATVNGEAATGFEGIGRLTPGSRADLIIVGDSFLKPYTDPSIGIADALVYRATGLDVKTVMVGGEVLMQDRELKTVTESEVVDQLAAIAAKEDGRLLKRWRETLQAVRPHVARFYDRWEEREHKTAYMLHDLSDVRGD